jgi:CubicO group peptidase (beta-lactamase class C family)
MLPRSGNRIHHDGTMQATLTGVCRRLGQGGVAAAMMKGGTVAIASADASDARTPQRNFDGVSPVYVNCVSRAFLATVLMESFDSIGARLEDELVDTIRRLDYHPPAKLQDIKIWQLLNHTHGLDGSSLNAAPRLPDGRIDMPRLCQEAGELDLIATPDAVVYNSGYLGSWLAAGALEVATGRRFRDLVFEIPFFIDGVSHCPYGVADNASKSSLNICAAAGGDLAASALDLISLMNHHIRSPKMAELRAHVSSFPGIPLGRRATACGWYDFWDGWFGHNGSGRDDHTVLMRFHPERQIAVVVTALSVKLAYYALQDLFRDLLPEFARTDELINMTESSRDRRIDTESYGGLYGSARWRIRVTPRQEGSMELEIWSNDGNAEPLRARATLMNSTLHVFRVTPPVRELALNILQFVSGTRRSTFDYIWNGRFVWRRKLYG